MVISEIKEILLDFCEYPDFIKTDMNSSKQKDILFKLLNLTHHYKQKGILSSKTPSNFVYTTVYSRQYFHKLHLLKLSLIDDTPLEKNFQINLQFCNVLNYIFILAMLKNKTRLVKFLLDSGFPKSINSSIFNTEMTPTYFMLSCVLKNNMYNLFLNYSPNHNITWNGLSSNFLLLKKNITFENQEWNFITTRQYELMCQYKGIKIRKTNDNAIFFFDFLIMTNKYKKIQNLLSYSPEIIQYSNFCFVFCTNFAILKILTIYSIDFKQSYGKLTPLHVSTYTGDLNMLLTFLIKTKNLDVQDEKGYTCLHIAALHKQYILLELLIRCGGNVNIKDNNNETVKQIYEKDNWIMKKPNVLDNELIVNLVDMDANDIGFKCSSIALDHIVKLKNFKPQSRFKIFNLLNFYSFEKDTIYKLGLLKENYGFMYKIFNDKEYYNNIYFQNN